MEEKESLKSKLIWHMIYNILAFAMIFLVFGIFVFMMVRNITYRSVDDELRENMEILTEIDTQTSSFFRLPNQITGNQEYFLEQEMRGYQDYFLTRAIKNPKIIVVLRNQNKEIINTEDLGKLADYTEDLENYEDNIQKIYDFTIDGIYDYRGINFKVDYEDDTRDRYIQLLINVDSEKDLIDNYGNIIASAVAIGILLSILASYILSKKTLKPLEENIARQMEFVQNASHELRTPLTIIQAKQELLLQEPNAKIIDKSEEIMLTLNETKRLTKLTKDLMLLSRADSENMHLQKESVNIDTFLENLAKPYVEIAQMQEKEMTFDLTYQNDVWIDTNRMYQLFVILLDNAIKYTEQGDSITIRTSAKDNKCVIEIIDTGIGISDEGLKRVFERFYREDKARNRETGGTGLGLSIADLIVTAHGGIIKASHNMPKGTIFTIRLPK